MRSAARYDHEMDYWLSRVPDVDDQVACLSEVLAPKWTPEERVYVIHSLSRIKTYELDKRSDVARTLQRVALEDGAAQVRQAAAEGLARMGAGEAVEEFAR